MQLLLLLILRKAARAKVILLSSSFFYPDYHDIPYPLQLGKKTICLHFDGISEFLGLIIYTKKAEGFSWHINDDFYTKPLLNWDCCLCCFKGITAVFRPIFDQNAVFTGSGHMGLTSSLKLFVTLKSFPEQGSRQHKLNTTPRIANKLYFHV